MKSLQTLLVLGTIAVLAGSSASAQAGKVTCTDGSSSAGGRGACSSHGGIMKAAARAKMKAEAKEAKVEAKAAKVEAKEADKAEDREMKGAIAECKDHTYSHAKTRRGVCSSHGGVAKFLGK